MKFDKEEKDILESFERGEWKQVENFKAVVKKHQEYAEKTLKQKKICNNLPLTCPYKIKKLY